MNHHAKPSTYGDYITCFSEILQSIEIGEPLQHFTAAVKPRDERIAQAVWFERLFRPSILVTETGKRLEILQPGQWNLEAGPDFLKAEIVLDGTRMKGDVEIHYSASGWHQHQHEYDHRYSKLILHAFMDNDDQRETDTIFSGETIERFCMANCVFPDIDTIRRSLSPEDLPYGSPGGKGKCIEVWKRLEPEWLFDFFDLAGKERLLGKVARLADCMVGETIDQVFYQALMCTMGYKGGKSLFFLLAKRTPIKEISQWIRQVHPDEQVMLIEAILLHVANLVSVDDKATLDPEAQEYLHTLSCLWKKSGALFPRQDYPSNKTMVHQCATTEFSSTAHCRNQPPHT